VKERESAEQNRTEETRSWDLHVFIAEALQTWIMQILSLQNKNKKASFAIPSINFLTSQKHPPLSILFISVQSSSALTPQSCNFYVSSHKSYPTQMNL